MKIAVIGTGYVGLVTGTCFSDMGNDVWCVDVDASKIENLKKGMIPIYEPGLESMVRDNYELGHLKFTTDIAEALNHANICFIAVGGQIHRTRGNCGQGKIRYPDSSG